MVVKQLRFSKITEKTTTWQKAGKKGCFSPCVVGGICVRLLNQPKPTTMRTSLLLLLLLCALCSSAQESFKKKYYVKSTIRYAGEDLKLKKETKTKFDDLSQTEKDAVKVKYPATGSEIHYTTEGVINGEKATIQQKTTVNDAFFKTLSTNKVEEVSYNGYEKAFVKLVEDKLYVNAYLKKKAGKPGEYEKRELRYFELKNRQTVKLCFTEVTVSALTVPLKYRFKDRDEAIDEEFSAAVNVNLFAGFALGRSSFHYREKVDNVINTRKFTLGALFGASTVTLNNSNTSKAAVPVTAGTEIVKGLASLGVGATFSYNKINVGGFYGYDYAIGDRADDWNYNKKPWLGIALGYSLFSF